MCPARCHCANPSSKCPCKVKKIKHHHEKLNDGPRSCCGYLGSKWTSVEPTRLQWVQGKTPGCQREGEGILGHRIENLSCVRSSILPLLFITALSLPPVWFRMMLTFIQKRALDPGIPTHGYSNWCRDEHMAQLRPMSSRPWLLQELGEKFSFFWG